MRIVVIDVTENAIPMSRLMGGRRFASVLYTGDTVGSNRNEIRGFCSWGIAITTVFFPPAVLGASF